MTPRLTLTGEVNTLTGYGNHLVRIFRGLTAAGVFVSIRALKAWEAFGAQIPADVRAAIVNNRQPEEWELLLAQPNHRPTPGRRTIFFTMWESTDLPVDFVANINAADAVIVPCVWCKRVFEDNGVTRPIFVVPLGIDPNVFQPSVDAQPTYFATAGRILHGGPRKGVNEVIRVFRAAFPYQDDVRLKVKVHPDDPVEIPDDARVEVIREHWGDERTVAEFLSKALVFVSGATGEGWGLWQQQAMACGRPVIGAIYGGLREFMAPENSYPVAYTEETAFYFPGKWATPDWGAMIQQMRRVYCDPREYLEKGKLAEKRARQFTWEYSITKLLAVLNVGGALSTKGPHVLHAPTPCRVEFPPVYPKRVLEQMRDKGWPGGYIVFPAGDKMHFNPGLVEFHGRRLLFARQARFKDGHRVNNRIIRYDLNNWRASNPTEVVPNRMADREIEDPRCWVDGDQIRISFVSLVREQAQQFAAALDASLTGTTELWRVPYGRNTGTGLEKNWMWFRDGGLRCIYQPVPHTVLAVENGEVTEEWATDPRPLYWQCGTPRGGTPPILLEDDRWYSFFHSCLPWKRERLQYYMGAYAFENKPPYRIVGMSREPLLAGSPNDPSMGQPHSVVYPSGSLYDGGKWTVVGGENDEACWWCEIPHEELRRGMQWWP